MSAIVKVQNFIQRCDTNILLSFDGVQKLDTVLMVFSKYIRY